MELSQTSASSLPEYKTACEGKLKDPSKYPSAIYHDERICFCTRACLRVFEQDPDPFMLAKWNIPSKKNNVKNRRGMIVISQMAYDWERHFTLFPIHHQFYHWV